MGRMTSLNFNKIFQKEIELLYLKIEIDIFDDDADNLLRSFGLLYNFFYQGIIELVVWSITYTTAQNIVTELHTMRERKNGNKSYENN